MGIRLEILFYIFLKISSKEILIYFLSSIAQNGKMRKDGRLFKEEGLFVHDQQR